jgi:hypothetical protein
VGLSALSWSSTQPSRVGSRECSFAKEATNPNGSPVGWICCDCWRVRQRSPKCGSGPSPRTTPRVTTSTPAAKGTGSSGATNRAGPPYHRLPSEAAPRTRHRSAGGKGLAYNHGDTNRLRCPSRPRRWLGRNTWPRCRLADCRPAQPPVAISCLAHRAWTARCWPQGETRVISPAARMEPNLTRSQLAGLPRTGHAQTCRLWHITDERRRRPDRQSSGDLRIRSELIARVRIAYHDSAR